MLVILAVRGSWCMAGAGDHPASRRSLSPTWTADGFEPLLLHLGRAAHHFRGVTIEREWEESDSPPRLETARDTSVRFERLTRPDDRFLHLVHPLQDGYEPGA